MQDAAAAASRTHTTPHVPGLPEKQMKRQHGLMIHLQKCGTHAEEKMAKDEMHMKTTKGLFEEKKRHQEIMHKEHKLIA